MLKSLISSDAIKPVKRLAGLCCSDQLWLIGTSHDLLAFYPVIKTHELLDLMSVD